LPCCRRRVWVGVPPLTAIVLAVASPQARVRPDCLFSAPSREPVVALTIDDAPDSATTSQILDVLAANGAHATFFVITGRIAGNESTIARMVSEGHELGNHFTADRASIRLDSAEFERDLILADSALRPFGSVRWARPGSGWSNARMARTLDRHGYRCALGKVYPLDAHVPWTWWTKQFVLGWTRPGSIIILHDGGRRGARTVDVLRDVLPKLRARGYRIVTLTQLVVSSR
jgi:peptidoglycan/xylan/chitin deacetylase (PgdA/CDA1 family)